VIWAAYNGDEWSCEGGWPEVVVIRLSIQLVRTDTGISISEMAGDVSKTESHAGLIPLGQAIEAERVVKRK